MVLTADVESLIHLIARALAKTSGNQTPHVFADVVLEHAKSLAAEELQDAAPASTEPVAPAAPVVEEPAVTEPVVAEEQPQPTPPAAAPLTTESVMEKVEGFVDHLLHPEANQLPSA